VFSGRLRLLSPEEVASTIDDELQAAWNAGDGDAYASHFTEDADLINVFGSHFKGREEIVALMRRVFSTIFRNSTTTHTLESAVMLSEEVILAHLSGRLTVPAESGTREMRNRQTFVIVLEEGRWLIRSFQNTGVNDAAPSVTRRPEV
jgi:uncharacterized protein (TIGR02246 family)